MSEHAPLLFKALVRRGRLEATLSAVQREAGELLDQLVASNGLNGDTNGIRMAAEEVLAALLAPLTPSKDRHEPDFAQQWAAHLENAEGPELEATVLGGDVHVQHAPQVELEPPAKECWECNIHAAVRRFSAQRLETLARKVVNRLRRFPATGIYHQDPSHRTLWDEYCFEIQEGPSDPEIEWGWEQTLPDFYRDLLAGIPHQEACLLTVGAEWELDADNGAYDARNDGSSVDSELIRSALLEAINALAKARDMSRFKPKEEDWF